jgi:predicted membrane protein
MRIFYSALGSPHAKLTGLGSFLLFSTALFLFLTGASVIYFILKYVFAQSFVFGLLFLFFVLPLLLRALFIAYLGAMALLATFFAFKDHEEREREDGDVIDVKGRVD